MAWATDLTNEDPSPVSWSDTAGAALLPRLLKFLKLCDQRVEIAATLVEQRTDFGPF